MDIIHRFRGQTYPYMLKQWTSSWLLQHLQIGLCREGQALSKVDNSIDISMFL